MKIRIVTSLFSGRYNALRLCATDTVVSIGSQSPCQCRTLYKKVGLVYTELSHHLRMQRLRSHPQGSPPFHFGSTSNEYALCSTRYLHSTQ